MEKQLHPFVDVIMEAQLPLRWKMLNIDRYDRLLDPDEHVDPFVTQMNLFTNDDAIMCRVFPTTLKGATLHWYTHLLRNSIDSFVTLVTQFEAQHVMSRPHHFAAVALANIR